MPLVLLLPLLLFLVTPKPAHAVPLLHQLAAAYQPISHPLSKRQELSNFDTFQNTIPTPSPTPAVGTPLDSDQSVRGASEQNIGGQGKTITIALLGDSMTDTIKDLALQNSLQKYYPNHKFNIINYGLGASNIEYGLYRLKHNYQYQDHHYPSLLSQKPDIIVIESFAYNNFGNSQKGIDRQWLALGAITTEITQTLPDTTIILAATITPNSVTFGNGSPTNFTSLEKIEKTNTIKLYLQNIVNFATSQNFPLADAYIPSLSNNQGHQQFINTTDHIHPSDQGAEFFCDTIASTLFQYKLLR